MRISQLVQVRLHDIVFLSDDITHLNQLYLFGHVVGSPTEDDYRRAFLATKRKPRPDGKDQNNAIEQPGPVAWRMTVHN